ncbi:hypothetical protein BDV93DRAFT_257239 [Ceratobasidium sp. AG-I]|nr:hypothetical protein BDV93DRAFT_257239 [Ceratobasidium sp. AG-I]
MSPGGEGRQNRNMRRAIDSTASAFSLHHMYMICVLCTSSFVLATPGPRYCSAIACRWAEISIKPDRRFKYLSFSEPRPSHTVLCLILSIPLQTATYGVPHSWRTTTEVPSPYHQHQARAIGLKP